MTPTATPTATIQSNPTTTAEAAVKKDGYVFPSLFEEADELMIVAILMYTMTEMRAMAKQGKFPEPQSQTILQLPLTLDTMMRFLQDNLETIKTEIKGHEMTVTALQSLQERVQKQQQLQVVTSKQATNKRASWSTWNLLFAQTIPRGVQEEVKQNPVVLTAYGDDKPDRELVYAVGMDPFRKRITVAFRGSVTPMDFFTDACMELNRRPNPVRRRNNQNDDNDGQEKKEQDMNEKDANHPDTIGVHLGFDEYLLKLGGCTISSVTSSLTKTFMSSTASPDSECIANDDDNRNGTKYAEIMEHVLKLFQEQEDRMDTFKLYVTGHSLGKRAQWQSNPLCGNPQTISQINTHLCLVLAYLSKNILYK